MNPLILLALAAPLRLLGPIQPMDVLAIAEFDGAELVLLGAGHQGWVYVTHTHPMLLLVNQKFPLPNDLRLYTNSGEVFPGQIEAAPDADHIAWRHPWLGRLRFPLDAITGVGAQPPPHGAQLDVLELADGDRMVGFCASLGPEINMEVPRPDGTMEQRSIPWRRIRALHLADARPQPPTGCSAFRDGTVVRLKQLRHAVDDVLHHAPHHAATHTGLGAPANGWTVLALGEQVLPLGESTVSADTPTTLAPIIDTSGSLNTGPVRLRGIGTWHVDVPPGMTRFRTHVQIPSELRHLAGGALVFEVDGVERDRIDLADIAGIDASHAIEVQIDGASVIAIRRTGGAIGEVGATVDLVDGVLFGDQ